MTRPLGATRRFAGYVPQSTPILWGSRMRVLVIEDDREAAGFLVKGLGESGYVVDHAAEGTQGLSMAVNEGYDVLIVDWMLPDLDGLELIDRYRAIAHGGPSVMVVTVKDTENDAVDALSKGADDYVRKPLRHREFLARIRALGHVLSYAT